MKIVVDRNSFYSSFQVAAAVAPARSPKTILQNVKIEADGNRVILSATDTEVGVRIEVEDVDVQTAGTAVLSVSRLNSILRETSVDQLEIQVEDEKTVVKGKGCRFELQTADADEFPDIDEFQSDNYFQVKGHVFRDLVKRTLFATDAESTRYALGGIKLEFDDEQLIAVGTDGRRLAKMVGSIEKVGQPEAAMTTIVPAKSMHLLERILPDNDELVRMVNRQNDLVVQREHLTFTTRLVEGAFPKWRGAIPQRSDSRQIELPAGPMHSALRQAAIVSSEESRGINFTFADGSLVLTNSTAEVGSSHVELPISYDKDPVTITLDHRFVADFLKVLKPEDLFIMDIEDGQGAALCKTQDDYEYVIMPLAQDKPKAPAEQQA